MRFGLMIVSAISLATISGAIARDNMTVAGLYQREQLDVYVPSGKLRTVGYLYGSKADCTPWNISDIEVRIVEQAKNGTVKIVPGEIVAGFRKESLLEKCNGKKMPALHITYKSNDKYVGTDDFELFVIWPTNIAQEKQVNVNVK
jgi:hypothetical protein